MPQQSKIYVLTVAYNAENTIRRAIESVLNQSYKNITYMIRDNGSIDNTYAICKEYAEIDDRVTLLHYAKNGLPETDEERAQLEMERGIRYGTALGQNDFFCILDADDEYSLDFFCRAVCFAEDESLDIIVGGTKIIEDKSARVIKDHTHKNEWIIAGQTFSTMFPKYHWHMRQIWGKLYRKHVLLGTMEFVNSLLEEELKLKEKKEMAYGVDTITAIYAFKRARKIGILAGRHHTYYRYTNSISHKYVENRVASDRILHKLTYYFLIDNCGSISQENEKYFFSIFYYATKDTIDVILNSDIPELNKIEALREVFCYEISELSNIITEVRLAYANDIIKWAIAQNVSRTEIGAEIVSEMMIKLYTGRLKLAKKECLQFIIIKFPMLINNLLEKKYIEILNFINSWYNEHGEDEPYLTELEITLYYMLYKPIEEIFAFLINVSDKRINTSIALNIDGHIEELMKYNPLLVTMSARLAKAIPDVICCIIKKDYQLGLNKYIASSQALQIDDGEDVDSYILLGINLSAAALNMDLYIQFEKMWISHLIENSRLMEAANKVDEYKLLLPNDPDFIELGEKISKHTVRKGV